MTDQSVLRFYDGKAHTAARLTIGVMTQSPTPNGEMIFNRYGDRYFLSEVRWAGYSVTRQLIKSQAELELAKNAAPERVVTTTSKR
jgi:hypothetical protein